VTEPAPRRRSALRTAATTLGWDLPVFAAATFVDQGGRLLLSLVAARLLGPADFGEWVVLALIIQYAGFGSLGVPQGAGREVPKALGAGDDAGAAAIEDRAAAGSLVSAVGVAALSFALAPALLGGPSTLPVTTLVLLAVCVFLQQLFLLEQVLYRSRLRFRQASVQLVAQGLAAPIAGFGLLIAGWGVDGLLAARAVVLTVALVAATRTLARVPRPVWDTAVIRRLAKIGLPLVAAGMLLLLLVTIDRWLVAVVLGRTAAGWYGLVGTALSGLLVIPLLISQQFYPRLARARGGGAPGAEILRLARQQDLLAGVLTAAGSVVVAVAAIALIPVVLPAYVPAIRPIVTVAAGVAVFAFASADGNLLNLLDFQRRYLTIQAGVLVLDIAAALILMSLGAGIDGVAAATASSMALYGLVLHIAADRAASAPTVGVAPVEPEIPAPPPSAP